MRVTKVIGVTLLPRAKCTECDWEHGEHKTTRDEAKWHVRSTGHQVVVITEIHDGYARVGT